MREILIRIRENGTVAVEDDEDGIKRFKEISPDSLLDCIHKSLLRGVVSSGLLPKGCLYFAVCDNGDRHVALLHPENRADISYMGSQYPNFPLPRLMFGFSVTREGRISRCRLGVVDDTSRLKPATPTFAYPFSNVSGTNLCTGNNVLPRCRDLYTLSSLPYYILGMDNNNDHFKPENNKRMLEMRDLLELLRDKPPEYYYTDILVSSKSTLGDFISERG
jgi:hypothetical protein